MDNFIFEIPNAISKELCQEMIERFENDDRKVKSKTKNGIGIHFSDLQEWNDIDLEMSSYVKDAVLKYYKHINESVSHLSKYAYSKIIENGFRDNGYGINKFSKNEEYYWHYDGEPQHVKFLVMLVYLNTLNEDEGGLTEFISGKTIRPEVGKIVLFPANWSYLHRGTKILSDNKYMCYGEIYCM